MARYLHRVRARGPTPGLIHRTAGGRWGSTGVVGGRRGSNGPIGEAPLVQRGIPGLLHLGQLDLDDNQQQKLQAFSTEMMTVRQDMKQQFGDDREQLLALLQQTTLDQQQLLTMIQSHTRAINERAPVIVASVAEFYDSLDSEQQAQLRQFAEQHRGRRHHKAME